MPAPIFSIIKEQKNCIINTVLVPAKYVSSIYILQML
jgi:hypothetical protein